MKTIELTESEVQALDWAIWLTKESFGAWSREELKEVSKELAALSRVKKKLEAKS